MYYLGLCKYTFAQRRNRLTTDFSERIPIFKRHIYAYVCHGPRVSKRTPSGEILVCWLICATASKTERLVGKCTVVKNKCLCVNCIYSTSTETLITPINIVQLTVDIWAWNEQVSIQNELKLYPTSTEIGVEKKLSKSSNTKFCKNPFSGYRVVARAHRQMGHMQRRCTKIWGWILLTFRQRVSSI